MRIEASQQLRLAQQMKLSPRIIQAMEILQLPIMALQERIEAELQSNPVLEQRTAGVDEDAPPVIDDEPADRGEHDMVVSDENGHSEDFERLAEFTAEYGHEFVTSDAPARPRPAFGERDRKLDAMANTPDHAQSLYGHLMEQWMFVETDKSITAAGELIVGYIEDDGYLRISLEQIAQSAKTPIETDTLAAALKLVQGLDPIGIGAGDLKECLLLQLSAEDAAGSDVSLEIELVSHFLHDIEMNRLPRIAQRTGKSIEQVKDALENISHLNPRPGLLVGQRAAPVISPDVMIDVNDEGEIAIWMPDGNTPQLHISKMYRELSRDKATDKTTKQFIQKNINGANWLIGAIEQRRRTVRRVVEEVFAVQHEFLASGSESLKPLPMSDIAGKVGVHVATVSRAVSGKFVQTPRGIYPLRMFFSGGMTSSDGKDVAWDAIKVRLKEIVASEDKAKPLNDDELAAELQKHGLKIARRTVAKYRNLLDIPPARKRREY